MPPESPAAVSLGSRGISFAVDDVAPATTLIPTVTLLEDLNARFLRKVLVAPHPNRRVLAFGRVHPLICAVHCAFSAHYPLTLSPDDIWLVIAQGFARHIRQNAEAFRGRLVRHSGRQKLEATARSLDVAAFETAIASFAAQIRDASDPVLCETLECDFSTTTPAARTASQVVLMDAYSTYFEYMMRCICGIPRITVTGAIEDWERIRARVEVLATYGLEWWIPRVRPILDEFLQTISGRPNLDFWKAIYKPIRTYGTETVSGWIADLFPYLGDAPASTVNHALSHPRRDWLMVGDQRPVDGPALFNPEADKGVRPDRFPSGLSSVPVALMFPIGSTMDVDFVAGFLSVRQSPTDWSISPVVDWCVAEPAPAQPVLV